VIEVVRYILAMAVVQTHLWDKGAVWTGQISVFAFYTLSGFLMTRVLNERYGFTPLGTAAFVLNRFLRLWPAYLLIMFMVLIALRFLPLSNFFSLIRTPHSMADITTNLIILGQVTFDFLQWLPLAKPLVTSWSLSIEVACYLLLAFFFARSPAHCWALFALGVVVMAVSTGWCAASANPGAYGPYCFQNRYGVVQAGFVPFAFGGLYHFHRKALSAWLVRNRRPLVILLGGAIAAMFAGEWLSATVGPFLGIPLMLMLLAGAQDARPTNAQEFFGRASYHLFIAHMPLAAVLVTAVHIHANSFGMYIATVVSALGLSTFLVPMERRINGFRKQIALMASSSSRKLD
jgi:peptidoglycan/LPS O-acetylase OafA/YrhL